MADLKRGEPDWSLLGVPGGGPAGYTLEADQSGQTACRAQGEARRASRESLAQRLRSEQETLHLLGGHAMATCSDGFSRGDAATQRGRSAPQLSRLSRAWPRPVSLSA